MGKKSKPAASEFVLFDVIYEDGTRSSRRKVPSTALDGTEREASAKAYIEADDRRIAEMSGRPRGAIKTITRSSR